MHKIFIFHQLTKYMFKSTKFKVINQTKFKLQSNNICLIKKH